MIDNEFVDIKSFRAPKSKVLTPAGKKTVRISATLRRHRKTKPDGNGGRVFIGGYTHEIELVFHPNVFIGREGEQLDGDSKVCSFYSIHDYLFDDMDYTKLSLDDFYIVVEKALMGVYPEWFNCVTINRKHVCDKRELIKEWVIPAVDVKTNLPKSQVVDLHCYLEKLYLDKDEYTWVERKLLGYNNDKYIIDVTPSAPIRENRDKDYITEGFSDEGNDAILSFSLSAAWAEDKDPDLSDANLNRLVYERITGFDEEERRRKYKEYEARKKKWMCKTFFKSSWRNKSLSYALFSNIYPFHGEDLSGCTRWFGFSIKNDDERGLGVGLCIAGFTFFIYSLNLQKLAQKLFIKHKPERDRSTPWNEYYPMLKKWEKEYKFEHFWYADWLYEFSFSRSWGLRLSGEFDGGRSKLGFRVNPFRNKFWNLI